MGSREVSGRLQSALASSVLALLPIHSASVFHWPLSGDFGDFPVEVMEVTDDSNRFLYRHHLLPAPQYRHDPGLNFGIFSSR